jgi:hypothetical protein
MSTKCDGFFFFFFFLQSIIEMAFCNKFGSLVRQSIYQNGQVPMGPMLNSIRCMPSTNLFIRGGDEWLF